jgi:hypothetical protein
MSLKLIARLRRDIHRDGCRQTKLGEKQAKELGPPAQLMHDGHVSYGFLERDDADARLPSPLAA